MAAAAATMLALLLLLATSTSHACIVPPHVTSLAAVRGLCAASARAGAHEHEHKLPPLQPIGLALREAAARRHDDAALAAPCAQVAAAAASRTGIPARVWGLTGEEQAAGMAACLEAGMRAASTRGGVDAVLALGAAMVRGGDVEAVAAGHLATGLLLQEVLGDSATAEGEYAAAARLPSASTGCVARINTAWAQASRGAVAAALTTLAAVEADYGAACPYRAHAWWNAARARAELGTARDVIAGRDTMAAAGVLAAAAARGAAGGGECASGCASWYTIDAATLLPQIMPAGGADEIDDLRADSARRLAGLAATLPGGCLALQPALAASHVVEPPFGWHYAGASGDRDLLEAYAALLQCNYNITAPSVATTRAARAARWAACAAHGGVDAATACWLRDNHTSSLQRGGGGGGGAAAALVASGQMVAVRYAIPPAAILADPHHASATVLVPVQDGDDSDGDSVPTLSNSGAGPVRTCFVSKYFTLNHPHAQLLAGVVRGVNRSVVDPLVLWLHNDDRGYFPDPNLAAAAGDGMVRIPATAARAARAIGALTCDALVYVDHLSEGVSTALTFMRLAPVQALFWGNPVTSGKPRSMDYFVSGDLLEPPGSEVEYSEKLVRLPASGIHYDAIVLPTRDIAYCACPAGYRLPNPPGCTTTGNMVGSGGGDNGAADPDALRPLHALPPPSRDAPVVFGCPQSLYKLRPEFDAVLARIMRAVPSALLVMVTERREVHSRQYQRRIRTTMAAPDGSGAGDVVARIRWVPRLSGAAAYFDLLSCIDVMLQPFPFDGSRTAADAIAAAIPLVTLPTARLRGRMAAALYTQLGLTHRLATSVDDYVRRAVTLATNITDRATAIAELRYARHLAFNRTDIVAGWERFLVSATAAAAAGGGAAAAAAG